MAELKGPEGQGKNQKRTWCDLEDGLFEQQSEVKLSAMLRSESVVGVGSTMHSVSNAKCGLRLRWWKVQTQAEDKVIEMLEPGSFDFKLD